MGKYEFKNTFVPEQPHPLESLRYESFKLQRDMTHHNKKPIDKI